MDRWLITLENQYDATAGTVVFMDVYGNMTENLQTHFEQHIKHAAKQENCRIIIVRLLYDLDMNVDFIKKEYEQFWLC